MVRNRRKADRHGEEQKTNEHLISSPICPESSKNAEDHCCPDTSQWKDTEIETVIKCEAGFFCEVLVLNPCISRKRKRNRCRNQCIGKCCSIQKGICDSVDDCAEDD